MTANEPLASQTSSHAPLEPISGTTLLCAELNRRANLPPPCATGCRELDEAALISGGFERGSVVGISAEEDNVALVLGLQTIARLLVTGAGAGGGGRGTSKKPRAMIVTTMGVGSLVGILREVLRAQSVSGGRETETEAETAVLGRVAVSRVFDINGLWEALGEVGALGGSQEVGEQRLRTPEAGQGEDGLLRPASTPVSGDSSGPGRGGESRADVPVLDQDAGMLQYAKEPSSSPLSDPPSSLPDIAPWETEAKAELDCTKEAHTDMTDREDVGGTGRTPPGQREEIQDSEAEEEGFSPPLAPLQDSPDALSVALPEERAKTAASPLIGQEAVPLQPTESSHAQNEREPTPSPIEAAGTLEFNQADLLSRPYTPTNAQDGKAINPQPKVEASKQIDIEKSLSNPSSAKDESTHPDIILITHMSMLLSSLFYQREKAAAHQTLQLLASHLRYLARSTEHGSPLIMILNSTTTSENYIAAPANDQDRDGPFRPPAAAPPPAKPSNPNKPLDPTLRSIFNPPPLPVSGLPYSYDTPHSRRNKPSFGLIFTQLLDLHLLCTMIPKTRADAEVLYAPTSPGMGKAVKHVWAIEVLLDENGVWEGRENVLEGKPRRFRVQRWGAVEVRRDGTSVRITDAFDNPTKPVLQQIVVAAGFGGPRV